jgi:hypothetical protein
VARTGGPQRRGGPQRGITGPYSSLRGGGVTGGGRWPAVNGELLKDREAVGVVAPPFATTDGFPLG